MARLDIRLSLERPLRSLDEFGQPLLVSGRPNNLVAVVSAILGRARMTYPTRPKEDLVRISYEPTSNPDSIVENGRVGRDSTCGTEYARWTVIEVERDDRKKESKQNYHAP